MKNSCSFSKAGARNFIFYEWVLSVAMVFLVVISLSACGNKEKKAGQTLVRVDDEEITILQLNDELQRSYIEPGQQEASSKQ